VNRISRSLGIAVLSSILVLILGVMINAHLAGSHASAPAAPSKASAAEIAHFPPMLILLDAPNTDSYVTRASGSTIAAADGRTIAQFTQVPPILSQKVSAEIPYNEPVDASRVGWQILSSVRYQGNGHTVYVTTARPTQAAAPPGSQMILGNSSFQLPDRSTAWEMTGDPTVMANEVRWFKNGLIVTVGGDLSIEELKGLAASVALK
jgi:hypothetical protein